MEPQEIRSEIKKDGSLSLKTDEEVVLSNILNKLGINPNSCGKLDEETYNSAIKKILLFFDLILEKCRLIFKK